MGRVIDIDKGWKRILKEAGLMKNSCTKIGVQVGTKRTAKKGEKSVPDMVTVAAANEFGVPGRIPERSFLRSSHDENREGILRRFAVEKSRIFAGQSTTRESLGLIGEFMQQKVKAKINSNIQPANAPSTAARKAAKSRSAKGGDILVKTLIDSSQMLNSIRHAETIRGTAVA